MARDLRVRARIFGVAQRRRANRRRTLVLDLPAVPAANRQRAAADALSVETEIDVALVAIAHAQRRAESARIAEEVTGGKRAPRRRRRVVQPRVRVARDRRRGDVDRADRAVLADELVAAAFLIVAVGVDAESRRERHTGCRERMPSGTAAAVDLQIHRPRRHRPAEERDHAAHRAVAVQVRRSALEHLDVVEHSLRHAPPVDPLAPRVVHRNSVEEHRGASFVHAADRDDLRGAAHETARARKLDRRDLSQHVLAFARRRLTYLFRREHVHRRGDLARLDRRFRRRDDHAREQERAFLERYLVRDRAARRNDDRAAIRRPPDGGRCDDVGAGRQVAEDVHAFRVGRRDPLRVRDAHTGAGNRRVRIGAGDRAADRTLGGESSIRRARPSRPR